MAMNSRVLRHVNMFNKQLKYVKNIKDIVLCRNQFIFSLKYHISDTELPLPSCVYTYFCRKNSSCEDVQQHVVTDVVVDYFIVVVILNLQKAPKLKNTPLVAEISPHSHLHRNYVI